MGDGLAARCAVAGACRSRCAMVSSSVGHPDASVVVAWVHFSFSGCGAKRGSSVPMQTASRKCANQKPSLSGWMTPLRASWHSLAESKDPTWSHRFSGAVGSLRNTTPEGADLSVVTTGARSKYQPPAHPGDGQSTSIATPKASTRLVRTCVVINALLLVAPPGPVVTIVPQQCCHRHAQCAGVGTCGPTDAARPL